jgi:phosphatidylglycerophosphate synthase
LTSGLSDTRAVPETPAASGGLPEGDRAVDTAVVLATALASDGRPAALLPWADGTILSRLAAQLEELGVRTTVVITRPAFQSEVARAVGAGHDVRAVASAADDLRMIAQIARRAEGSVLLAYGEIVTHRDAVEGLVVNPSASSGILAGARRRPLVFRVQTRRGRVVSAASPYHSVHRPNASFLGVLRTAPQDVATLAAAAERLAELVATVPSDWQEELERKAGRWRINAGAADEDPAGDDYAGPEESYHLDDDEPEKGGREPALSEAHLERLSARTAAAPEDVVALLVVGLVRAGVDVSPFWLRRLFWARPFGLGWAERAAERIQAYDLDDALLQSSVKATDGFFTSFFVSPYSKYIARWAARRGLTPNQITTVSMLIGALAAAAFATGERWGLIAGAVLLQVSFTTDCVDGQLARYTRQFSRLGAWLDSVFDRTKEYLTFAGLAIGAARSGDPLWTLACAAITLQTVRHMSDFAYMTVQQEVLIVTPQTPVEQPLDHAGVAAARRRAAAQTGVAAPPPPSLATRVLGVWHALDHLSASRWIKRMIAFPIGERFALISITAALFTPRTTFVALLAWGGLAFVYTQTGRTLRSVR